MSVPPDAPSPAEVLAAAARIAPHAHVTPIHRCSALDALAEARLHFKCEQFQRAGAFKFRGATNAVWALDDAQAARGVVTHSSGNHGGALALAARTRGIACHVVVPEGATRAKVLAIQAQGASVHRCAPDVAAREAACAAVQAETGAVLVHPYVHPGVIAGQGTAALELLRACGPLDDIVVPVGGGGLAAGTALAIALVSPTTRLFLAEPEGADDAARSLASGQAQRNTRPDTVCDGLRADIGAINLAMLRQAGARVLPVSDADTIAALRLLATRAKLLVEPSAATVLAGVLRHRDHFRGRRVGLVLSGGNLDLDALSTLLALAPEDAS